MQAAKRDQNEPPTGGRQILDQSIGIDENNKFHLKFYSSIETVGATVFGSLWALEWAWHSAETNMHCAGISGICMHNPSIIACIASKISAFIRTTGQTDMARSTRLVIVIKNKYILWGRKTDGHG